MHSIKNILIVSNTNKTRVKPVVETVKAILEAKEINYYEVQPSYFKLSNKDLFTDFDNHYRHKCYDLIIAIGGDGTFLYTARTFLNLNIPIIGINAGRVGFLMEVNPEGFQEALDKICSNKAELEKRILLELSLERNEKIVYIFPFLNDAVVSKGDLSRMVEISLSLDQEALSQYRADGLIVSTPTGSTAYNLAAGGPILTPDTDAMIITPICPHTLGVRPIVTRNDKELCIHMISDESGTTLTIDGQENFQLLQGDIIRIKKSPIPIQIFDYGEKRFFSVLRKKLGWHI